MGPTGDECELKHHHGSVIGQIGSALLFLRTAVQRKRVRASCVSVHKHVAHCIWGRNT